jgi:transcriptional regulator with XRE-family HTH domain
MPSFGTTVRAARQRKDLSQEALARLVNVSTRTIANIEAGVNLPRLETARALADALDVSLGDLLPPREEAV